MATKAQLEEELDYTKKGLEEWRQVALEALEAIKDMQQHIYTGVPQRGLETAAKILYKYPYDGFVWVKK